MYTFIHTYIYVFMYMYVYVYIHTHIYSMEVSIPKGEVALELSTFRFTVKG
jgi:hypothetical protein